MNPATPRVPIAAVADGGTATTTVPAYDRSRVTAGIAHIGVGAFHRTHQAVYVDELLAAREDHSGWGIVGIGLQDSAGSRAKAEAFWAQDCLYTVTAFGDDDAQDSRVVGSMVEYLYGPDDPAAVVERLADPDIRIVSLTISEGGYNLDEETHEFRVDAPEVANDLRRDVPHTAFGVLVAALQRRRAAGTAPFTVMSCDNLRSNGDTARTATLGYARAVGQELADWIEEAVAFPNSMVDRIAPTVGPDTRERLNAATGIDDALPALTEEFRQWVLEDRFPAGRPAWEEVGVELRDDVEQMEVIKVRNLNASHMLLAYPAVLSGFEWVHDAASDPALARLLRTFMADDVAPLLDPPSDVSLADYQASVVARFANPHVADTIERITGDGGAKLPVFHRATAEGLIAAGRDLRRPALLLATYRRYTFGVDDNGHRFVVDEPNLTPADWELLHDEDPLRALESTPFVAWRLADSPEFVEAYLELVKVLEERGAAAAVEAATR